MKHGLEIQETGYGHWKITTTHYNKVISCTTTNSTAIDDYNSEDGSIKLRGYKSLREEIIRKNKENEHNRKQ